MAIGCAIGKVSMEAVSRGILVFYISYADRARTCHVHPGSNPVATEVSARLSENLPEIVFIKVRHGIGDGVCGGEALLKAGASA